MCLFPSLIFSGPESFFAMCQVLLECLTRQIEKAAAAFLVLHNVVYRTELSVTIETTCLYTLLKTVVFIGTQNIFAIDRYYVNCENLLKMFDACYQNMTKHLQYIQMLSNNTLCYIDLTYVY